MLRIGTKLFRIVEASGEFVVLEEPATAELTSVVRAEMTDRAQVEIDRVIACRALTEEGR